MLQEKHCQHKSNYNYTPLVARLIETCYQARITRLKELATLLGISTSYAHYLIKKLNRDVFFKIWASPHYDNIGLHVMRVFLQARSNTYTQILLESLSRHDFILYIARCYGNLGKGVYCEFLVPSDKECLLLSFLESLADSGIVSAYDVCQVIEFGNIVMGFEWYDYSTNTWLFNWQALFRDVFSKVDLNKHPLITGLASSPESRTTRFDFYDLCILHYLEQDVFTPLTSLALKLGTSPQNLSYHFRSHVLKNNLIRTTRPKWYPFLVEESSPYILDAEFEDNKALNCFLESLNRKPIAYSWSYCKRETGHSVMIAGVLPYDELFNFIDFLDLLREHGILKRYDYYLLDIHRSYGKLLPYHYYDEAFGWRCDFEPYLKDILRMAKKVQEGRASSATKFVAKLASAADSKIEPA